MAACPECGAALKDGRSECPSCSRSARRLGLTVPLGSPGEPGKRGDPAKPRGARVGRARDKAPLEERAVNRAFGGWQPSQPEQDTRKVVPPSHDASPPRARRFSLAIACAATGLAVLAGLVMLLHDRGPGLSGRIRFDDQGRPEIVLYCPACADGTDATVGSRTIRLAGGRGVIPLPAPVSLGRQRWTVILRADGGKVIEQDLEVKVDWVVSADLRGLAQPFPKLAIVVDAEPEVGVIVDGRALPATPSGARRHEIDIRDDVTGASTTTARVSRRVPYVVTSANGSVARGELELSADVVPLRVDAPGESLVIESSSFMLAGTTQADGSVTVEGRPITVDPAGRFAQLMSVSAPGDTSVTVRAAAPGRAPRLFLVRVKRVASLQAEAEQFARRATNAYTALADSVDEKRGWAVALTGTVSGVKSDGYSSELTLDVSSGCATPPCPLLARWGAKAAIAVGDRVTIYGHLAGKSSLPDSSRSLPEVRVEFWRGAP